MLCALGADVALVRRPADLDGVEGLVIPGGESTVIDRLTRMLGLAEPIRSRILEGMPVLGTCAGLILLSDRLADARPDQQTLGGLDVLTRRNAFGAQNESFEVDLEVPELGRDPVRTAFIRAPVVEECGDGVRVLAALPDGRAVAVEHAALLGLSFHPEVTAEPRFHQRFLARVRAA